MSRTRRQDFDLRRYQDILNRTRQQRDKIIDTHLVTAFDNPTTANLVRHLQKQITRLKRLIRELEYCTDLASGYDAQHDRGDMGRIEDFEEKHHNDVQLRGE